MSQPTATHPIRPPDWVYESEAAESTRAVARALADRVRGGEVIGLRGPLASGKTCFAGGLAAAGIEVEAGEASLTVQGVGGPPRGGARITVALDHRMGMAFLVLGMVAEEPVGIDDSRPIDTSFPGFVDLMNGLGAAISPGNGE